MFGELVYVLLLAGLLMLLGKKISCETPPTHLLRAVERKRP